MMNVDKIVKICGGGVACRIHYVQYQPLSTPFVATIPANTSNTIGIGHAIGGACFYALVIRRALFAGICLVFVAFHSSRARPQDEMPPDTDARGTKRPRSPQSGGNGGRGPSGDVPADMCMTEVFLNVLPINIKQIRIYHRLELANPLKMVECIGH